MNPPRILVAGIGNIFLGDDAFGVETLRALRARSLPLGVSAIDFGLRGHDLAFTLAEGWDAAILVDATPRGRPPGTLSVLELDLPAAVGPTRQSPGGHSLDPVAVLHLAAALGARVGHLYLVGCEPAVLEPGEGPLALSAPVRAAVPHAIAQIESLLAALLNPQPKLDRGPTVAANP